MKKHIIRSIKYFIYIIVFFLLVVTIFAIFFNLEGNSIADVYRGMFKEGAWFKMLLFFVAYAIVYPFMGYQKKEIYTNENLATRKEDIKELFENANFVLQEETPTSMTFVLKNKFLRFIRIYEDAVVLDYSEIPATISGLRKDTLRFSRSIEYMMRERDEQ